MKILSTSIFELAAQKNISEKHAKLLLFCLCLLFIKFLVMPILDWQIEVKEETDFYKLQYRNESSIIASTNSIIESEAQLKNELHEVQKLYYQGSETSNQVKINGLIDAKVAELGLRLSSKNSGKLYEKNGVITVEYTVRVRGYALELQEFAYWLDNISPKLLIQNVRFSSSRGASAVELNVRFQQLILKEAFENE
ncbi:hypothetical protein AAEU29_19640 [Pseudoalteromonas sp. SSM20]|uniref:hypothetical protein n=1 Tax=Pseudoalteromonas sp. SSM20 TaxID=3139394 RepID=UPI003BAC9B5D